MMTLGAGMVIFVGLHLIPTWPRLRGALVGKLGDNSYRGLFSLAAGLGFGLVIWGKVVAPYLPVFQAPAWGRHVALTLMPVSMFLMAATYLPTRTRAVVRHPMLLSVLIWSACHLLANGDLASALLFGGMGIFAVVDLASYVWRGASEPRPGKLWADAAAVLIGVAGYAGGLHVHAAFGHPVWY